MIADPTRKERVSPGLAVLLQSSDSMFPSGAYAHSLGLEGAVEEGLVGDSGAYARYLEDFVVPQMVHLELPYAGFAYDAARANDLEGFCRLDREYGAMKATRELREASRNIGSQRLVLIQELWGDTFVSELSQAKRDGRLAGHETLVLGVQAARTGLSRADALASVYYLGLALLTNAVVKLVKIGQRRCQQILSEHLSRVDEMVERASRVEASDVGWFVPFLEVASARHETAYSRLFIS